MIHVNTSKLLILLFILIISCSPNEQKEPSAEKKSNIMNNTSNNWKQELNEQLPLLGHRNWILIVDKAFPLQSAKGMTYINTNENLIPVLQETLKQISESAHIKPIIYRDKELSFITDQQVPGIKQFVEGQEKTLGNQPVQTILHDSVFQKLDKASGLFSVLVIKTNEVIPYSSVFIELDCKYWDGDKETALRNAMK